MALEKQFSNKLEDLWRRRIAKLRAIVIPRNAGQPATFSRRVRDRLIVQILEVATELNLKREGKNALCEIAPRQFRWKINGRGLLERGSNLLSWAESKLEGPIIYTFWREDKCLYVGQGKTWKRLRQYEKSAYLLSGNRIKVFHVTNESQLGKAECLATHLFQPSHQKVRPARAKWGKKCPICLKHDKIRDELNELFSMK